MRAWLEKSKVLSPGVMKGPAWRVLAPYPHPKGLVRDKTTPDEFIGCDVGLLFRADSAQDSTTGGNRVDERLCDTAGQSYPTTLHRAGKRRL